MNKVPRSGQETWAPPALRSDLINSRQSREGRQIVVIKHSLARTYFTLAADDYDLACLFDGKRSCKLIAELAREKSFTTDPEHVVALASQLLERGLLVATTESQRAKSRMQVKHSGWMGLWVWLSGLLFARIPLVDPDALLTWAEKHVRWCWSKGAVRLAGILVVGACIGILARLDEFPAAVKQSMNLPNLAAAWVLLVFVKIIHELGHGLTCKHYGGEVRELGLLLIVFSPFFYVNVSDSYLFPRKHQRVLVAAAGIAVELVIAAITSIAWSLSRPGPAREVLFGLMMITSIWTVLFNANPLMKFDGYYMLSDLTGIPNLRQKAMNAAVAVIDRILFGIIPRPLVAEGDGNGSSWLAAFGLASQAYLLLVMGGILALFRWFGAELGLRWAGDVFGAILLLGMLGIPMFRYLSARFRWLARQPGGPLNRRWLRRLATIGALALVVSWLPVPSRPVRKALVMPVQTSVIRSEIAGRMASIHVIPGQRVQPGDLLMTLASPRLQSAVEQAEHQVEAARLNADRLLGAEEPGLLIQAQAELLATEVALRAAQQNLDKTRICSPAKGIVVTEDIHCQTGRGYRPGEVLCEIVSEGPYEAYVPVEEQAMNWLPKEAKTLVRLKGCSNGSFESMAIQAGYTEPFRQLPESIALALEKELAVVTGADGRMLPLETFFGVRVPLPSAPCIRPGMTGSVRFECGSRPFGSWLWQRWLEFMDPHYRL